MGPYRRPKAAYPATREEPAIEEPDDTLIEEDPAREEDPDGALPAAEEPPSEREPPGRSEEPAIEELPAEGEPAPLPAIEEEGLTFRLRQPARPRQRASARLRERKAIAKRFIQKTLLFE